MRVAASLRTKITAIMGAAAILVMGGAGFGLWQLNQSLGSFDQLLQREVASERQALRIEGSFKKQVQEWKNVLLRGQNPADLDKYWTAFVAEETQVQELAAELERSAPSPAVRAEISQFRTEHKAMGAGYRKGFEAYKASGHQAGAGDKAVKGIDRAPTDRLDGLAQQLQEMQLQQATTTRSAARRAWLSSVALMVAMALLAVILTQAFITAFVIRPVTRLGAAVQALASGDFSSGAGDRIAAATNSHDELGKLAAVFLTMYRTVRGLLDEMAKTADRLGDSAGDMKGTSQEGARALQEVARAMGHVATGAAEQAGSVREAAQTVAELRRAAAEVAVGAGDGVQRIGHTGATLSDMVRSIDVVAGTAAQVAASSAQAGDTAQRGAEVVAQTIRAIGQIESAVRGSAATIATLGTYSTQIGEITAAITEIAAQTNLLALNAAIEAARAGEHGRGFAVVADEVRKLAERAGGSAGEIAGLVQSIQGATRLAVEAMGRGTAEVDQGAQLAAHAGTALSDILASAEHTSRAVREISDAAQQVAESSQQVTQAFDQVSAVSQANAGASKAMAAGADVVTDRMSSVARITQQTATGAGQVSAAVEQVTASTQAIAAAAETLSSMASQLEAQVARFRL